MRTRRQFLAALGAGALSSPLISVAQQGQMARRIGVLSTASRDGAFAQSFPDRLRRIGYDEGRNLRIEWRFAMGHNERLSALADEVVRLKPELIVAHNNESIAAVKRATRTIPIVMQTGWLPVENGFVESLARPGGNITGAVWIGLEQSGKVLQLLGEALPRAGRIAVLRDPSFRGTEWWEAEEQRAATQLGMKLQYFGVARLDDVEPALEQIGALRPDALFLAGTAVTFSRASEIAKFAIERKLPTISNISFFVDRGALLSYGPDILAITDRTASFVDRILRGAKPADLPVELPAKFELVINAKTASAIGYKIPQSLLARADRVIE